MWTTRLVTDESLAQKFNLDAANSDLVFYTTQDNQRRSRYVRTMIINATDPVLACVDSQIWRQMRRLRQDHKLEANNALLRDSATQSDLEYSLEPIESGGQKVVMCTPK